MTLPVALNHHRQPDTMIARYRHAAVMHLAANADVGESVRDPGKYYRNKVAGTLTLREASIQPELSASVPATQLHSFCAARCGNPSIAPPLPWATERSIHRPPKAMPAAHRFGLALSTATINPCVHEGGRAVAPVVEAQITATLRTIALLHAAKRRA